VRGFYGFLVEEEIRERNPVRRGQSSRSGRPAKQGLVRRVEKAPWIPNEDAWDRILRACEAESLRNRLMVPGSSCPSRTASSRCSNAFTLTDDERAALEGDRDAITALAERLAKVPTPAGPTPEQLGTDRAFVALTAVQDSLTGERP